MPIFRRLPWHSRLFSLHPWQPIQSIEITGDGIRLEKSGGKESLLWDELNNAIIVNQSTIRSRREILVISDILSFEARGRRIFIDLSLRTPHFERGLELRELLLEKLRPRIEKLSRITRLRSLFMIVSITLIIVVPLLYFFSSFFVQQ